MVDVIAAAIAVDAAAAVEAVGQSLAGSWFLRISGARGEGRGVKLPLTPYSSPLFFDRVTRMPAPVKKSPSELQNQENEVYKALRAWYMIPGIQRELRHKENEAVQTVLEVFESRKRNRKASET